MDEEKENNSGIKITLVGNSGVGKTCIILRYTTKEFDENVITTKGANYSLQKIEIDGKEYQLDIWDTAGQEHYRSLGKHFYKDAFIVILVYDVTNKKSFEDLKNSWFHDLNRYGEKCTVLGIVGNKCDLYEQEMVTEEEGRKFAEETNALFMLVSAKNGDNIDNLFTSLVKKYLEPTFQVQVDENSEKKEGSVKIKKRSKQEEDKIKERRSKGCCG